MRWTWASPLLTAAALGCCRPAPAPDPLHDLELAAAPEAGPPRLEGPTLWVTRRAVVAGQVVVAAVADGGVSGAEDRLVEAAGAGDRGLRLGVDRRLPFGAGWQAVSPAVRGPTRLELLVGDRASPGAIAVCALPRGASPERRVEDCWGRPVGARPPEPGPDAGPAPRGADHDVPLPGLDWGAPLELVVRVSPDELAVFVQGRAHRVLRRGRGSEVELLGQTLSSLRRRNAWDRQALVRPSPGAPFADLVEVLEALSAAGHDALAVQPFGA